MEYNELLLNDLLNYSGFHNLTYHPDDKTKIHRLYRTALSNICIYLTKQNTLSSNDIAHIYIECEKFTDSSRDFKYVFNKILCFFRDYLRIEKDYYEINTNKANVYSYSIL